ncbi:MAG: sarcosine oxidase subunit alpha family protein [Methyloceanibacter sp.]|uniref:sarcosine oxidase subunit alpha family protein n=1 Tax=Methyloceanibacter sp. TaxID=1965321 RepID=UPI003D6CD364
MAPPQVNRLRDKGLVDRKKVVGFNFDGVRYTGHPGDTLASALLANGIRLVGRSFKYHRPRGILTAGSEEPNALVELRTGARREPNTRATTIELYEGLNAASQNRWPSLKYDLLAVNQLASPIFGAGFYYKTFMWPPSFWEKVYEPMIRRAAGLGRTASGRDPDHYEKANAFCDVLAIGGGAAGLSAALAAGRAGARVILCEEDFRLGGRLLAERDEVDGTPAAEWAKAAEAELESLPDCRIMRRTTVFGVYDGGTYAALERVNDHVPVPPPHEPRQRLWRIVAKRAVLCAGAHERPLLFGDNDRPGVMLAGAVRAYVNRFGAAPGHHAVIFADNDDAFRAAADLGAAGIEVKALVDPRRDGSKAAQAAAEEAKARYFAGAVIDGVRGAHGIKAVAVRDMSGATVKLDCSVLAMSGGWNPAINLTTHLNGKPVWDHALSALVPGDLPPGMSVAGAAAGKFDLDACLARGEVAGAEAAKACGFSPKKRKTRAVPTETPAPATPLWQVEESRGKAFVDFQNDVTASDVKLAAREGFRIPEHVKRYTTLGMATDQGKTSNLNGAAVLANFTGRYIGAVGTTTFRPPYTPVAIAALAGHHVGPDFRPSRLAPSHAWAVEQGAVFVETGAWMRALYYPRPGESPQDAVNREVATVRTKVGVCDVSTLGKIDVQGPDAGVFLDRVYANTFSTLPVGKARYGIMLREDGFAMDDGTTARLAEDRYFMTTTTVNAVKVMQHLEFCQQVLWPELDVQTVSVTEQWAQYAVAGPNARKVIEALLAPGQDISNEAFPYMSCGEFIVCGGVPARLYRLSFSGELAYEIGVPARFGDAMIRAIMEAGAPHGIAPYGTEPLGVLRIEKGHPAGPELNGQTTAHDLGMGRMVSKKKDFIGRFMGERAALNEPSRPSLVGLRPIEAGARVRAGAHLVPKDADPVAANDQGYVTSMAYSPEHGRWIALATLSRGPERHGEVVKACDPLRNTEVLVEVCPPCFIDPEGARLRV